MTGISADHAPANPPRVGRLSNTHNGKKYAITVRIEPDGREISLAGREAWTMRQLVEPGERGITSMENPAPRLGRYIFKLRRAGFIIETEHEAHGGAFPCSHGRYRLHTPVTILEDAAVTA